MRTEVAQVMGAPPGQTPPENSRVKVIIVPEKKGPAAKGAEGSKESAPLKTDKDVNK